MWPLTQNATNTIAASQGAADSGGSMWPLAAAGAADVGNIASTIMTNQANQQNIQQQENYQTQMSDTAYQRASADMKAAGLNPAMMYGSGGASSTPSGGAATFQAPQVNVPNIMQASNLEIAKADLALRTQDQQNRNLKNAVDITNTSSDTDLKRAQELLTQKQGNIQGAESDLATMLRKGIQKLSTIPQGLGNVMSGLSDNARMFQQNFDNQLQLDARKP